MNQMTLTVEDFGQNGDGVVIADDQRLYIPYTTPGDTVLVTLITNKKGRYKVVSHEILERGKNFAKAPCPHYGSCGSCQLQHFATDVYSEFKREKILRPLRFEGFENPEQWLKNPVILPAGHRRRANFNYRVRVDGVELGYHKYHSYELLTLESCHVLMPIIVDFMKPLQKAIQKNIPAGFEGEVFITAADNGLDVHLDVRDRTPLTLEQREWWGEFAREHDLCRLQISLKHVTDLTLTYRTPTVLFDDVPVESDCRGFLQPSALADQELSRLACALLPEKPKLIADLFCGRGTLSFPLSKHARVHGYELEPKALAALESATRASGRPIETYSRDLFTRPLSADEMTGYDVAVIDPPRAGAEEQCKALAESGVENLIYVSCNPLTFARDARFLTEGRYEIVEITPLDQFRWTIHVEAVALFKLKS